MNEILMWLSGKKGVISTILMGVVAYLATKGIIGEPEVALLTLVIGAVFGVMSYATGLAYKSLK